MLVENDILIPELARLLSEEKEVRITPSGDSMRPFIEGGRDSVVIAPLAREPRRGDILLARAKAENGQTLYVIHRVLRIETSTPNTLHHTPYTYILQGDGNIEGVETCSREDIIGRVVRIETPSGHKKPLTRGLIWQTLRPIRHWLLKIYRHL